MFGDCERMDGEVDQVHVVDAEEVDQYRCMYRCDGCIVSVHTLMSLQTQGFPEV